MSDSDKSKPAKKHIADVKEPGTTAPSPTSRPVIVTNRSLLRGPMMTPEADADKNEDEESKAEAPVALAASHEPKLEPLDTAADSEVEEDGDEAAPAESTLEPQDNQHETPTTAQNEPTHGMDTFSEASAEISAQDNPPGQADNQAPAGTNAKEAADKQAEAEAAAEAKRGAETQQLIESRRYVLPIDTAEKRKSKRFVVLGIVLAAVLILIWLDIALDAGIITLGGLKPLTHFFSN